MGTIEAYAVFICLVVIDGAPLQRIISLEAVGLGSVVMVELEDVVQTQRHHVVYAGLMAFLHDAHDVIYKPCIAGEGLASPFSRNGFGAQFGVPC